MTSYHLAIDIGASSGRHIVGWYEEGTFCLREIYRFKNGFYEKNGRLCWDAKLLFDEVLTGMQACGSQGFVPKTLGIDTWAVDFVLLDRHDALIGDCVAYRDPRTVGIDKEVQNLISDEVLYARTGIQKLSFNTLYQLYALKKTHPEDLRRATCFLMLPDYLHFLLTGQKANEYTNASTTQLVSATTHDWDRDLIQTLGFPADIFGKIEQPKKILGTLTNEIQNIVGFPAQVVLPATHDTASAVVAMPSAHEEAIFLSSGTWSLMGVERERPALSEKSRLHNFSNEGGYAYRFRCLKNIMGLWMLQSLQKESAHPRSFSEMAELAQRASDFQSLLDVDDAAFLAPKNMRSAICDFLRKSEQKMPVDDRELFACVYHSLAKRYASVVQEIEDVFHLSNAPIHIIGGGSQDIYLNTLIARSTGKKVYAGPTEATAIGNCAVQMLAHGTFSDLQAARQAILKSFPITQVLP